MESWTGLKINNWIILSVRDQMVVLFTRAKNLSDYQKAMTVFETSKLIQLKVALTAPETSNCQMVLLMPTWESVWFVWLTQIIWSAAKRQSLKEMYPLSTFLGFRCVCGLITAITFQLHCNSWNSLEINCYKWGAFSGEIFSLVQFPLRKSSVLLYLCFQLSAAQNMSRPTHCRYHKISQKP